MAAEYIYNSTDFITSLSSPVHGEKFQLSQFDQLLRKQWEQAMKQGYFTYKLDDIQTRIVPGKFSLVLQLNTKRGKQKRRADFVTSMKMPFDANKFNFNKIRPEEVLVNLRFKENDQCSYNCPVIINMSPLEYGHVLLVPHAKDCLPQVITPHILEVGLHYLLLTSHRGLYVAFNGLCAMASVNHLHMHAWYLEYPTYPQTAPVKQVCGDLHLTMDLPVPAYVFELCEKDLNQIVKCVSAVCSHLQENDIAHNVMILRGATFENNQKWSVRAYVWPRRSVFGEKNAEFLPFNLAVAEVCCHIPYYLPEKFENVTEDDLVSRLKEESLPDNQMEELTEALCSKYKDLFTANTSNGI